MNFDWSNARVTQILDLYIAWFNRVPDVEGMTGWITKLQSGESIQKVSEQFLAAAYQYTEQTGYMPEMTDHQFIVKLYEGVLGRTGNLAPNQAEAQYWIDVLKGDMNGSRGEMVLRMLQEAKAFNAEGRPDIQAIIDTLNNKTLVSKYALDQGIQYGSAELSIIQGKAFLDGINGTSDSALEAKTEVDLHIVADPATLPVEQLVRDGDFGMPYKLLDTLKNIAAQPQIAADAESYSLTNWEGTVGAITIQQAEILRGAANYFNYDYSLADTVANLKAMPTDAERQNLIKDADTVAAVGTNADELISFAGYSRGVIINGNDGWDNMTGSSFNDTFYGGDGNNIYCGGGGRDTFVLTGGDSDTIYLTKLAMGGAFNGANTVYVKGFESGDKLKIAQADFSADLQGSFTPDDYFTFLYSRRGDQAYIAEKAAAMHGIGVIEYEGPMHSKADLSLSKDGTQFFLGLSANGVASDYSLVPGGWDGFTIAYDNEKAYIYYSSDNGDGKMYANEMHLVATVERPSDAGPDAWMGDSTFIM